MINCAVVRVAALLSQVQEAVKRADAESKAKIDKIQEIKHLHLQIEAMRSELSKFEEQLEECRRYKAFIDGLTPQEFFDAQEEQRRLRSQRRIEDWEVREAVAALHLVRSVSVSVSGAESRRVPSADRRAPTIRSRS